MSINRSRDFGFGDRGPSPIELAPWAVISATTGSPTTGQFTYMGVLHNFWKWTASGSVTFSTAGLVRALLLGGGGGAGIDGGGGGGGFVDHWLHMATGQAWPIIIGAGGARGAGNDTMVNGDDSYFASLRALGGGHGAGSVTTGAAGGSGGASGRGYLANGGAATLTYGRQGYDSYLPTQAYGTCQGGGGAGGVALGPAGGPGGENAMAGPGKQWIDQGTYYAGGGNGTSYAPHPIATFGRTAQGWNGAANTGAGGGCGPSNGGSGVVIIAIPVL